MQQALPTLERLLEDRGDAIFQIDFTQEFSSTLDRKALVEHLDNSTDFAFQGFGFPEASGTILDNTASVGEQFCTWMQTTDSGYTTRTKLPNKIVYQFEAGEVQDPFWGHLADYVCSTDKHLFCTQTCKKEVILEGGGFAQKQGKNWYKTPWRKCLKREKVCLWYSNRNGNGRTLRRSWAVVSFLQIDGRERSTWLGKSTLPRAECRG